MRLVATALSLFVSKLWSAGAGWLLYIGTWGLDVYKRQGVQYGYGRGQHFIGYVVVADDEVDAFFLGVCNFCLLYTSDVYKRQVVALAHGVEFDAALFRTRNAENTDRVFVQNKAVRVLSLIHI